MARAPFDAAPALLGERQARVIGAWLAAGALLIFWIGHATDIDLVLADLLYDSHRGLFPWRHAWLTETFSHLIVKTVLTVVAVGFVLAALVDLIRPRAGRSVVNRLRLRIVALSALLVPLVISSLKQVSNSHCPWDLARYGGSEPYLRLFQALPEGVQAGHCLPAGHASSALWLIALCVYWLPAQPKRAWRVALATLLFGGLLGIMQQLRGAHFLTHTLWSAWIACALVLLIVLCLQYQPQRRARQQPQIAPDYLDEPLEDAS